MLYNFYMLVRNILYIDLCIFHRILLCVASNQLDIILPNNICNLQEPSQRDKGCNLIPSNHYISCKLDCISGNNLYQHQGSNRPCIVKNNFCHLILCSIPWYSWSRLYYYHKHRSFKCSKYMIIPFDFYKFQMDIVLCNAYYQ